VFTRGSEASAGFSGIIIGKKEPKFPPAAVTRINYTGFQRDKFFISFAGFDHDVSNENDCRRFIESTINNFAASTSHHNPAFPWEQIEDTSVDVLEKWWTLIFLCVYCTRLPSIDHWTKRNYCGVSSIAGYRGLPGRSGYSHQIRFARLAGIHQNRIAWSGWTWCGCVRALPVRIS